MKPTGPIAALQLTFVNRAWPRGARSAVGDDLGHAVAGDAAGILRTASPRPCLPLPRTTPRFAPTPMTFTSLTHDRRRWLLCATGALAAASLPGCSMFASGPATLNASLVAGPQLNPDARRRPSPAVVRVYELKAPTLFEQADFVSLFEKDQATLAAELVSREELVLRPGETKPLAKPLGADTKFIGVMVAFRELERARWRAVVPVVARKKNVLSIELDGIVLKATRTSPK